MTTTVHYILDVTPSDHGARQEGGGGKRPAEDGGGGPVQVDDRPVDAQDSGRAEGESHFQPSRPGASKNSVNANLHTYICQKIFVNFSVILCDAKKKTRLGLCSGSWAWACRPRPPPSSRSCWPAARGRSLRLCATRDAPARRVPCTTGGPANSSRCTTSVPQSTEGE